MCDQCILQHCNALSDSYCRRPAGSAVAGAPEAGPLQWPATRAYWSFPEKWPSRLVASPAARRMDSVTEPSCLLHSLLSWLPVLLVLGLWVRNRSRLRLSFVSSWVTLGLLFSQPGLLTWHRCQTLASWYRWHNPRVRREVSLLVLRWRGKERFPGFSQPSFLSCFLSNGYLSYITSRTPLNPSSRWPTRWGCWARLATPWSGLVLYLHQ